MISVHLPHMPILSPVTSLLTIKTDTYSQGTNYERTFGHGSLLQILRLTIILHATSNIMELRAGLFKVANFENGKRMVLYYGFGAIVRFSCPLWPDRYIDASPGSLAGSGKSILWYAGFRRFL